MKKLFCAVITFALCLVLAVSVFAARDVSYENDLAKDLRELGLFSGVSANNFDLERAPTRTEVLVMLIRVLGVEDDAKSGSYSHPFTDVPAWADPYVGYAYEKGLTQGVSKTKFGTGNASAVTYLTFMLRALGYSDTNNLDFKWDNPYDLAKEIGILPACVDRENFWRADIVSVSYAALGAKLKGSEMTLAEKLIEANVFTLEAFREYYHKDKLANAKPPVSEPAFSMEYEIADDKNINATVGADYWVLVYHTLKNPTGANIGAAPIQLVKSSNTAVATAEVYDESADSYSLIIHPHAEGTAVLTLYNSLTSDTETINVTVREGKINVTINLSATNVSVPVGGYVDVPFSISIENSGNLPIGAPPNYICEKSAINVDCEVYDEQNPMFVRIYGKEAGTASVFLIESLSANNATINVTITGGNASANNPSANLTNLKQYILSYGTYLSDSNITALYTTYGSDSFYLYYDHSYNVIDLLAEFVLDDGTVVSYVEMGFDGSLIVQVDLEITGVGYSSGWAVLDKATLRSDSYVYLSEYTGSYDLRDITEQMLPLAAVEALKAYDMLFVNNVNNITAAMLGFTSIY